MSNNSDTQGPNPTEPGMNTGKIGQANQDRVDPKATAKPKTEAAVRDARLKAALKANMARRKGQARARAGVDAHPAGIEKNE